MNPITIGRTVLYVLSEADAETINSRRTRSRALRLFQANGYEFQPVNVLEGNEAQAGDVFPAVAVRIFQAEGQEQTLTTPVNFQVLLDGNDSFWATSRSQDTNKTPGTWHWPARA